MFMPSDNVKGAFKPGTQERLPHPRGTQNVNPTTNKIFRHLIDIL